MLGPFDSKQEPQANFNAWSSLIKAHPNALAYLGVGVSHRPVASQRALRFEHISVAGVWRMSRWKRARV
ncbi:MAG TPA: hypothetical protein VGD98_14650 [Ktedonobacteraceae bacterium]